MGKLIHKFLPRIMNYLAIALLIWACYYGWGLYQVYSQGYEAGLKSGAQFYQRCLENHWRSLSFAKEKGIFIEQNKPKKNPKTWKDSLYNQGWESAIDKATENVPK